MYEDIPQCMYEINNLEKGPRRDTSDFAVVLPRCRNYICAMFSICHSNRLSHLRNYYALNVLLRATN